MKSGDIDALINKSRRVPNLKNRVDEAHALEDYKTREDLQRYKLNYNFGLQVSLLHHSCYEYNILRILNHIIEHDHDSLRFITKYCYLYK